MTYGRYDRVLIIDRKDIEALRLRHTPIKNQVLASNPKAHAAQVCASDGEDYPCTRIRLCDTVEDQWRLNADNLSRLEGLVELAEELTKSNETTDQQLASLVALYEAAKARVAELEERLSLLAEVGDSDEQQ